MRVTQKQLQKQPSGFTTIQLVITVAVVAVVSAFAAYGIRNARASMRLANDTRQLASFLEKARADSIRRSARIGFQSSVQIVDNNTYIVSMGFGGSDLVTTQTFDLSEGVTFASDPMTITFDWRGRPTSGTEAAIALQNFNDISQIDVTGSGDITIGSDRFQDRSIPDVNLNTNMSGDADVAPDPSNTNGSTYPTPTPTPDPDATPTPEPMPDENPTPTPEPTPTPKPHGNPNENPTPTPTPTPEPTPDPDDPNACSIIASASTVTISKNGGSENITITLIPNRSGTVTASTGATNLKVSPARLNISEGGSVTFTVTSLDNTRGNFTVTFTTPCGSKNVTVSIVN